MTEQDFQRLMGQITGGAGPSPSPSPSPTGTPAPPWAEPTAIPGSGAPWYYPYPGPSGNSASNTTSYNFWRNTDDLYGNRTGPEQMGPLNYGNKYSTDPMNWEQAGINPLPQPIPIGTPQPVPQFPRNGPSAFTGPPVSQRNIDWGNQLIHDQTNQDVQGLADRYNTRVLREGTWGDPTINPNYPHFRTDTQMVQTPTAPSSEPAPVGGPTMTDPNQPMDWGEPLPRSPDFGPSDYFMSAYPSSPTAEIMTPPGIPGTYDPGTYTPFTDFPTARDPNVGGISSGNISEFNATAPPPSRQTSSDFFDISQPAPASNMFVPDYGANFVTDQLRYDPDTSLPPSISNVDPLTGDLPLNDLPQPAAPASFNPGIPVAPALPANFPTGDPTNSQFINPADPNNNLTRGGVSMPLYPTPQDTFPTAQPRGLVNELGQPTDWAATGRFFTDISGNIRDAAGNIVKAAGNFLQNTAQNITDSIPNNWGGFGQPSGYFGIPGPPIPGTFGVNAPGVNRPGPGWAGTGITLNDIIASGIDPSRAAPGSGVPAPADLMPNTGGGPGNLGNFSGMYANEILTHLMKFGQQPTDAFGKQIGTWTPQSIDFWKNTWDQRGYIYPSVTGPDSKKEGQVGSATGARNIGTPPTATR